MNCACHGQITLNDLVAELNKLLGKNLEPVYGNSKPGDIKHSFASIDLIPEKLNYKPLVEFKEGLKRIVEYFRSRV